MSTLSDLLAEHTDLPGSAVDHLQRLVGEWQLLADLSFSDLALWVREDDGGYVCVAQVRPTTGATVWPDDLVSRRVAERNYPVAGQAWTTGQVTSEEISTLPNRLRIRRVVIPVRHGDRVLAVMNRDSELMDHGDSSLLETVYLEAADDLLQMVAEGSFPASDLPSELITGPRAGDGLLRLDSSGTVTYGSPNALSAYHRLGLTEGLVGAALVDRTKPLIPDPFDAAELATRITSAVEGRPTLRMEVEARAAAVVFRALPLWRDGSSVGALVLVRDVTEVRRRDRALLSKDATIREIHHRVKNNLQTVAALLRLQARRSEHSARAPGPAGVHPPGRHHRAHPRDVVHLGRRPRRHGPDRRPAGPVDLRHRRRRGLGAGAAARVVRGAQPAAGDAAGDGAGRDRAERRSARLRADRRRRAGADHASTGRRGRWTC